MNRRKFLSFSALAGAGAMVVPQIAVASVNRNTGKKEEKGIVTRVLGKTGLEIPILSMGVMRADNPAVVRAAYNSGLTHFDTAHGYQNGKNEEMLGVFFKDKDRSTFTITTKGKANPNSEHFEAEYEELLNISLRRLQMDYVDIFYAHA
ncbi:MAG: aldo/keto reductase, partial [Candidatus Symbiothrix sp.]|nr:aldo/keto reductase [Candidatus Symbiothrix sp.]